MATMSTSALASFFADLPKSIYQGENHYNSKQVQLFEYFNGVIRGSVRGRNQQRD